MLFFNEMEEYVINGKLVWEGTVLSLLRSGQLKIENEQIVLGG
jgi:hypothetical protein